MEIRSNVNPLKLEHRNDNDDSLLNDSKKENFFPEKPYQILYQGERKNTKTIGEKWHSKHKCNWENR